MQRVARGGNAINVRPAGQAPAPGEAQGQAGRAAPAAGRGGAGGRGANSEAVAQIRTMLEAASAKK